MAHFAQLDENNNVLQIVSVNNAELLDENNVENEQKGIDFLIALTGHRNWKQTSYNANFRARYAMIGGKYDAHLDCFVHPSPYPSWIYNAQTGEWDAPVQRPSAGGDYYWSENLQQWLTNNDLIANNA